MKAYKATKNMKCLEFTYEVGKTYKFNGEIIICEQGFHFCEKAIDTLIYYPYNKDFVLLEIEAIGEIVTDGEKSVTNELKVLRIIPQEEYSELLGITLDSNGNMTKQVMPDGYTYLWEYVYDSHGNMTKQVMPDGDTYLFEYDSNGNMTKQVSPDGKTFLWEYDSNGNKTKQVSPDGFTWSITITD